MPRKPSSSIVPTFLLKGIEPKDVLTKYKNGFYNIKNLDKDPLITPSAIQKPKEEVKSEDLTLVELFRNVPPVYKALSNKDVIVNFQAKNELRKNGTCGLCGNKIDGTGISIPIRYSHKSVIQTVKGISIYRTYHIFWGIGEYCDFIHAYTFLIQGRTLGFTERDFNYSDSERYLQIYYSLMHPENEPLHENNHPCILESNGGTVSNSEFNKYKYKKSPCLFMFPIPEEYFRV